MRFVHGIAKKHPKYFHLKTTTRKSKMELKLPKYFNSILKYMIDEVFETLNKNVTLFDLKRLTGIGQIEIDFTIGYDSEYIAIAITGPKDRFCRKTGRDYVTSRINESRETGILDEMVLSLKTTEEDTNKFYHDIDYDINDLFYSNKLKLKKINKQK